LTDCSAGIQASNAYISLLKGGWVSFIKVIVQGAGLKIFFHFKSAIIENEPIETTYNNIKTIKAKKLKIMKNSFMGAR